MYSFEDYTKIKWSVVKCPKCSKQRGKSGRIRKFRHIDNGKCFMCEGKGMITRERAIFEHTKWLRDVYFKDEKYSTYSYSQLVKAYDEMVSKEIKEMGFDDLFD